MQKSSHHACISSRFAPDRSGQTRSKHLALPASAMCTRQPGCRAASPVWLPKPDSLQTGNGGHLGLLVIEEKNARNTSSATSGGWDAAHARISTHQQRWPRWNPGVERNGGLEQTESTAHHPSFGMERLVFETARQRNNTT